MRIVFMGTPGFAVAALEYLLLNGHDIAAVYTRQDKPAGRGRALALSPVKQAALRLGLRAVQPASLKKAEVVAKLASCQPDAIAVCAYGQILPRAVLDLPPLGCINVHPSLLPRFRGASPIPAAILAGDDFTGVSIMLMDEGLDTGPVLMRAAVPVSAIDTTGSLTGKLSLVAARLLNETLLHRQRHEIEPQPQDSSKATYSRPLTKEQGEIDWQQPAATIWRQVRAFNPWPGSYTRWAGKQLKVLQAQPAAGPGDCSPGTVVLEEVSPGGFGVCTGEGVLAVREVQLEGKRAVPAADFLRGQRGFAGAVLPG